MSLLTTDNYGNVYAIRSVNRSALTYKIFLCQFRTYDKTSYVQKVAVELRERCS